MKKPALFAIVILPLATILFVGATVTQIGVAVNPITTNTPAGVTNTVLAITAALGPSNDWVGSFTGYGAALTNLNASSISSGTIAAARLPSAESISTNTSAITTLTNPVTSGVKWTNTTTGRVLLSLDYTLTDSAVSGDPGLCMTNMTTGEWFNATNSFALAVAVSGRTTFLLAPNDVFIVTNQSSSSASATLDASWARMQ